MVAVALGANGAVAAADEPSPTPTPEPVAAPAVPDAPPTPEIPAMPELPATPEIPSVPALPGAAEVINYITTVTTTTTTVNAPIIVVAAPITTTTNNTTAGGATDGIGVPSRLALSLTGCGRPVAQRDRVREAHVRLAQNATLVVRVNGKRVATLRLPPPANPGGRGVALRLRLAPDGMLTIQRPSGRVLAVQGCTPA